ncbi:hypothetical protein OG883_39530 [Streptomyces sp. NBC_01142]|uniref:hypothetical protein n=1 Tax=Streptomyces sp. NBC_01142 TaxID=2975865 RepID=UPI00225A9B87|nr:hypothetical protein [Streptomyces sp. NBC_01142]MCX4825817.1 hypothetical protein [Streptomyces sp. NBC_01142]
MRRRNPKPADATVRNYADAVYGSLLAASVIATAGTLGTFPRLQLVVMLLTTSLVFWIIHVYARLVGDRLAHQALSWATIRHEARAQWPIAQAALLPAAAVAVSPSLGLGPGDTAWLALGVALAEQVAWATAAVVKAGAPRRLVAVTGAVNLVLGLVLVAAKTVVQH